MKATKLAAALGMSVGLIAAGAAYAADTSNMTVQANVVGSCKFNSTPTLDFGNLDPANATNGSGSSTMLKLPGLEANTVPKARSPTTCCDQ